MEAVMHHRHEFKLNSNIHCSRWFDDDDVILAESRYVDMSTEIMTAL